MVIKTKFLIISLLVFSSNASAALIERLGGLAYYDDVNDLTWLADANYAQTSGYDADGKMTWDEANTWASTLDIAGVTGWRLPGTIDVGNDGDTFVNFYEGVDAGYNITTHSEMSNMFYNVLGNLAWYDTTGSIQSGGGITNSGPFSNLQFGIYWSGTEFITSTNSAWYFYMGDGSQYYDTKTSSWYAWAVYDGDVGASAVPVPAAVWLFGSGLISLIGLSRRRPA